MKKEIKTETNTITVRSYDGSGQLLFNQDEIDPRTATASNLFNKYKSGFYLVHKTTRAGATTSMAVESLNRNEQFLAIVPTNAIARKTLIKDTKKFTNNRNADIIQVPSNHACIKNEELCKQYPVLKELPVLPIPNDCKSCGYYNICPITEIIRNPQADGFVLTYQKLMALYLSPGSSKNYSLSSQILGIIKNEPNNILLDEIHEIQYGNSESVTVYDESKDPKFNPHFDFSRFSRLEWDMDIHNIYEHISRIYNNFKNFKKTEETENAIFKMVSEAKSGKYWSKKLSETIQNPYYLIGSKKTGNDTNTLIAVYKELIELTKERKKYKLNISDIKQLYSILNIITSDRIIVNSVNKKGHVAVNFTAYNQFYNTVISEFLQYLENSNTRIRNWDKDKGKRVMLTSATICSYDYSKMLKKPDNLEYITFGPHGDPMGNNKKLTIFADNKKYNYKGKGSFYKFYDDILDKISTILEGFGPENCTVICMSSEQSEEVEKSLKNRNYNVDVTYYKSTDTIGVSSDKRVMIAIGRAEKPSNAYDSITKDKKKSKELREEAVHSDTWQAWSRVKDPEGKSPSYVFALLCNYEDCINVVKWGFNRRVEILKDKNKTNKKEIKVDVDKQNITLPEVVPTYDFEEMCLKAGMNEQVVELYKKGEITTNKSPYYNIIGIFSEKNTYTLESLPFLNMFVNRRDTFAEQKISTDPNDKTKTPFYRQKFPLTDKILQKHLDNEITIGTYSMCDKGYCRWICYDIDAHTELEEDVEKANQIEMEAEDKLKMLTDYLDNCDIKYLLEYSGSPHSYHVWIFIEECPVYKTHKLANTIARKAGVSCEVNPKQKIKNRKNEYGNLVKLPLGINRKNNNRSKIWHPEIQEWVTEFDSINITVYDVSRFNPEDEPKNKTKRNSMNPSFKREHININGIRPCIQKALDKNLTGEEGHMMRVAIVREYYNFGFKDTDELVRLFENQVNFDYQKSKYQVESIIKHEFPIWNKGTLQEKCGSYLDCKNCDCYDCKALSF